MYYKAIQILNIIKATQNSGKNSFCLKFSKFNLLLFNLLKKEGFISHFQVIELKKQKTLKVFLNYGKNFRFCARFEKVFLKNFSKKDFWKISSKVGCIFLKTSVGVSCDRKAKIFNQGGSVMFYVN